MPRTIRVPNFTDLSDSRQLGALVSTLRKVQNDAQKVRIPRAELRGRQDLRASSTAFRAVEGAAVPGDATFGEDEIHVFVGGRYRKVTLEDI